MSDLWGHLATAVATAAGIWLLGVLVARRRAGRRGRRRAEAPVGSPASTPAGEFGVWTFHGPVLGRRRNRVQVRPGTVSWCDPDGLQPRWQVPADRVDLLVRPPTWFVDVTRLTLTTPDGRRRVRVARGVERPLGSLDTAYEAAVARDTEDFVRAMGEAGAQVTRRGCRARP